MPRERITNATGKDNKCHGKEMKPQGVCPAGGRLVRKVCEKIQRRLSPLGTSFFPPVPCWGEARKKSMRKNPETPLPFGHTPHQNKTTLHGTAGGRLVRKVCIAVQNRLSPLCRAVPFRQTTAVCSALVCKRNATQTAGVLLL